MRRNSIKDIDELTTSLLLDSSNKTSVTVVTLQIIIGISVKAYKQ